VRANAASGQLRALWDWASSVSDVSASDTRLRVTDREGTITDYEWLDSSAHVARYGEGERGITILSGFRDAAENTADDTAPPPSVPDSLPYVRELGEADYRMSEHSWTSAGSPRAHIHIDADGSELEIRVDVRKSPLHFRAPDAPDPALDNEHPDIHSDGVQLHIWCEGWSEPAAWLAIPEHGFSRTRVRQTAGGSDAPELTAESREIIGGYEVRFAIPRNALCPVIALDVLVNDMSADRQRRRGQLVLSGARGDRVYLRGDRQPLDRFIRVRLPE
jgi:hypothetical protein